MDRNQSYAPGQPLALLCAVFSPVTAAPKERSENVKKYWTKKRRAAAVSRDLFVDDQTGRGYIASQQEVGKPLFALKPYGLRQSTESGPPERRRRHKRRKDLFDNRRHLQNGMNGRNFWDETRPGRMLGKPGTSAPPEITEMSPAEGDTIGYSNKFSAVIQDDSGIKSVVFIIIYPTGRTQKFRPYYDTEDDMWSITLHGFSTGQWRWKVVAKDWASQGGNTAESDEVSFNVHAGGGTGGCDSETDNSDWTDESHPIQNATGRIYFEMPNNRKWKKWIGYVCSGTVVTDDEKMDRSVILTAAHCVYDDVNKAFARNVWFIPDQDGTTGGETDDICTNDPLGNWESSFGVVDESMANNVFPDNIPYDYGFYVVKNDEGYCGPGLDSSVTVLDDAAGLMPITFESPYADEPSNDDFTQALGYTYSSDPNLMCCAGSMADGSDEDLVYWWLGNCGLSGGSSGGPWIQPAMSTSGSDPLVCLNSWGYSNAPGMGGPKLNTDVAENLFDFAKNQAFEDIDASDGNEGVIVT